MPEGVVRRKTIPRKLNWSLVICLFAVRSVTAIREKQVLETGRAAGPKDVKVASFSASHTALKFVIPVAAR